MKLIEQGGIFMYPLIICSIVMVAIISERGYIYFKTMQKPLIYMENPTQVVKNLRKRLITLNTIIAISPMLGLLGTITGLMKSFSLLGDVRVSSYKPQQISLGISEALITTAAGLIIAVIATIFYNYFTSRLESYVEEYNSTEV